MVSCPSPDSYLIPTLALLHPDQEERTTKRLLFFLSASPMASQLPLPPSTTNRPFFLSFSSTISVFIRERAWAISFLLVLLCFLIFFNIPESFLSTEIDAGRQSASGGGCDYTYGRWVWDESLPQRTYSEDCQFLDIGFQCRRNGRRDAGYVKWRWQPHGCDLPRFNASNMLERSRNGRIVFAGDSIGRNHWESLVCMLARAVQNQSSIYEKNGNPITKHKGYLSIRFHDYNLTVEYYRAPFLVLVDRPPPNSPPNVKKAVRVDTLHSISKQWVGADILVFNDGHWWNQDKTFKLGRYFQEGDHINTTMDVREAFKRSLETWKRWVLQNVHPHKSYVFFRSFSSVHFGGDTWDKGGHCNLNTAPETNMQVKEEPWSNQAISKTIEQMRGMNRNVQFLNITYLTEFRGDGHPSNNREPGTPIGDPQDCSHWCLPGVPDTWNHLLYAYLLMMGKNTTT